MTPAEVAGEVSDALNRLRPLFKDECELTFIMRTPSHPETEMVVTNDELGGVIETLKRSIARDVFTALEG